MEKLKIKADVKKVEQKENSNLIGFANLAIGGVVIKDVAVIEKATEKGKIINFNMPVIHKYENKEGEMIYIHTADISNKDPEIQKNIIKQIKGTLIDAITQKAPDEYGRFVAERETEIEYDKDYIKAFATPIESENYPRLKASGIVYLGGILKLNNIKLTEYTNENNETKMGISFPSDKFEKDGEIKYQEKVFPIVPGLRTKINETMEEAYLNELHKENIEEQTNDNDEEDEDLEL